MANPATLLADQLLNWGVPPGQTISGCRVNQDVNSVEFWRAHGQAVRWLLEIERFIAGLDAMGSDAAMYTESFPAWYQAIFAIQFNWDQPLPSGTAQLDRRDLRILRSLGAHMETAGYAAAVGQVDQLQSAVIEAEELVRSSPAISTDTRRYLLGLIREALDTLSAVDTVGEVAVRSVMFELGGAMTLIAGKLPDNNEGKSWRSTVASILAKLTWMTVPYALDVGAQAIGMLPPG